MTDAKLKLAELRNKLRKLIVYDCFGNLYNKTCLFTNKVDKCSCCAGFVGSFGGCSAQYFSLQCKIV